IAILAGLPGSTGELRRLASIPGDEVIRIRAVSALCDRPEAVPWLLRNGLTGPDDWSGNALRVAAAVDLPTALRKHRRDVEVVRQAAYALLSAPRIRTGDPRGGLVGYPDAVDAYVAFADACDRLPHEDRGLIARILGDLYFHVPALLPWPDGTRDRVAGRLTSAIASTSDRPGLVQRARERSRRRDFAVELVPTGTDGDIEVCVLVRGRPLLTPLNFGSALSQRSLTPDGPLRAEEEPREIELANGNCVPECCGGLFVTIRREGGEVVWDGFRQTMTRDPLDLPELRFDADAYDAELERTDRGHFGQIADP
ncbi:MAG TPA: hypothetical protein VGF17_27220, partial [Phytomonospora sp.]